MGNEQDLRSSVSFGCARRYHNRIATSEEGDERMQESRAVLKLDQGNSVHTKCQNLNLDERFDLEHVHSCIQMVTICNDQSYFRTEPARNSRYLHRASRVPASPEFSSRVPSPQESASSSQSNSRLTVKSLEANTLGELVPGSTKIFGIPNATYP